MRYSLPLIAILLVLAALRVLYIGFGPFDLSPDEAHYWEWSRRLGLSYYSKGPLVAYVIAFFTWMFGDTELGVRIGAVVFSTLGSLAIYLIGKNVFESRRVGFYAALLVNVVPIFSIGSILMTTDVLLVFFWAAGIHCVKKAVEGRRTGWWYAAGVAAGLGFLAKYTMALFLPCIFLFLLASREDRFWIRRREPYIGALVFLVVSSPVILWNLIHGQVTIRHTLGQVGSNGGVNLSYAAEFLGSQALLLTPLVFLGLAWGVIRCGAAGLRERNSGYLLVFFTTAPVFLLFLLKALHGKVQANWAVASYVAALPAAVWAVGRAWERATPQGRKILRALVAIAVAFGAIGSLVAYFPMAVEALGAKRILRGPPYNRVTAWEDLGQRVSAIKAGMDRAGKTFVMSDTYQITSELAFYTEGNPAAFNADTGSRRMNQYDLWPGPVEFIGADAIYVRGGDVEAEEIVRAAFTGCTKELFRAYRKTEVLKEFSIFRCYGFKGLKGPVGERRY